MTYAYDANGNVISKTDARGITTNYAYEVGNRLTQKTYSNNDPAVTYSYDAGTYGKGRRTGMADAPGSASWTYE